VVKRVAAHRPQRQAEATMYILLEGIVIGFVIAVPVGPVGLLCINRGLYGGAAYGFFSWLGIATGDALAGGVAALGLTLVSDFFSNQQPWLQVIVGLALCCFGLRIFMAQPATQAAAVKDSGFLSGYASTFFLTLTNPMTIPSFLAIYAGWGVKSLAGEYFSVAVLAVAIFFGTVLWWLVLGASLLLCRDRFSDWLLCWIHRVSGVVIAGFGLVLFMHLIHST
jgi:threonine/homoserine/homoserine lactone efflux protein